MAISRRSGESLPIFGSATKLGLRIKSVRLFLGLSQSALAKELGVSQAYLSEVEGDKGKPTIEMVVGIADNYPEIDSGWLLSGRGHMLAGFQPGEIVVSQRGDVITSHDFPAPAPTSSRRGKNRRRGK